MEQIELMKSGKDHQNEIIRLKYELETKNKLLSSIHKISGLLTRSISIDKVLNAIVEETAHVFGVTRVNISLVNKKNNNLLECKYVIGFTPEEERRALNTPYQIDRHDCLETRIVKFGKTIYVKDYMDDARLTDIDHKLQGIYNRVSGIAAPLKIKREIIGFIGADKTREKLNLTRNEIDLFSTFANQASIIIENARLQEQNKRKIEQLLSLQKISKKTSNALSLKKLFGLITTNALKITKASTAAVFLIDARDNYLKIVSEKGYAGLDKNKFRLRIGEGVVGYVADMGTPLLVRNVQNESRYVEVIEGVKSELAVPLVSEEQVLGVLNVDSFEESAFCREDLELLTIFAGHTAILIENARLYEQIIAERNFAENILESSPNAVITISRSGRIGMVNKTANILFGLERREVVGRKAVAVLRVDILDIINLTFREGRGIETREVKMKGDNGTYLTLEVSTSFIRSRDRQEMDVLLLARDLTEAKKAEAVMRRMDRLTSLGQLSAGIAHEIRNPLASINLNVQMLSKKLAQDDRTRAVFADTLTGISRINRLIRGIHDFAKPGITSLKKGCINDIILDSVSLLDSQLKKRKIDVSVDIDDQLPAIVFDPLKMQQVFINLFINAMDAMPEGGALSIRTGVAYNMNNERDELAVHITDNGIGIDPGDLSKIFDPFFTTKPEGTGLGLSITHKILEQHNAIIETESTEESGTTFIMRFPLSVDTINYA